MAITAMSLPVRLVPRFMSRVEAAIFGDGAVDAAVDTATVETIAYGCRKLKRDDICVCLASVSKITVAFRAYA